MSYFNTTNESDRNVASFTLKAKTQDGVILNFLTRNKKPIGASGIWKSILELHDAPLTSVRRSLNTLTKLGLIEKTNEKIDGIFGRKEYEYKLI